MNLAAIQKFAGKMLATAGGLLPGLVTIGGKIYDSCTVSTSAIRLVPRPDGGGLMRHQQIDVWISRELMPERPAPGATITFDGVEFADIESGDDNTVGVMRRLTAHRSPS